MADEHVVEARALTRTFGHRKALDAVDLNLGRGETVALFGPNGAGKTTLLRILTSTLRPTSGTVTIAGLDPRVVGDLVLEAVLEDRLYVFTDPRFRKLVERRHERLLADFEWAAGSQALRSVRAPGSKS